MAIPIKDVYRLADPFIVFEDKSQSPGQWIIDLNYMNLEMRKSQDGIPRIVRGNKSLTRHDFFNEVSAAFQFPYYFGENWDALDECLNDLDWLPATDNYLVIVTDADQLLAKEDRKELDILTSLLEGTARNWGSGTNHDISVRAYQAEVIPRESTFAVAFQVAPDADQAGNFMQWLKSRPDISRISS